MRMMETQRIEKAVDKSVNLNFSKHAIMNWSISGETEFDDNKLRIVS